MSTLVYQAAEWITGAAKPVDQVEEHQAVA